MIKVSKITLARTDNLGDVALTVPLAGFIKKHQIADRVAFLGTEYSKELVAKSRFVDEFYSWDTMRADPLAGLREIDTEAIVHVYPVREIAHAAKAAKIPIRIGVANRWFNWLYCNRRIYMSRKRGADLHESQFNMRLLSVFGPDTHIGLEEIAACYGWVKDSATQRSDSKKHIIFHPLSYGHGCEWPLSHWYRLAQMLDAQKFDIEVTGSREEGLAIKKHCAELLQLPHVNDHTGRYQLKDLIAQIESCDALLASGTGPLHIAGIAGVLAIGLYPPVRPIHPGRWGVIGERAVSLCKGEISYDRKDMRQQIAAISPQDCYQTIVQGLNLA